MVYQSGTAADTFSVFTSLTSFMSSLPGWQLWSDIAEYDKVYFSSGDGGQKDIYLRIRAAANEPFIFGLDQQPLKTNGDTGFINFFAYNYFPENGDAYSGFGEVGILGPRFYHFTHNEPTTIGGTETRPTRSRVYYTNILSQKPGGTYRGIIDTGEQLHTSSTTAISITTRDRRRWVPISSVGGGTVYRFFGVDATGFDGRRYFYNSTTGLYSVSRHAVARFGGGYQGVTYQGQGAGVFHTDYDFVLSGTFSTYVVVEDKATRTQYLYYMDFSSVWKRINLQTLAVDSLTGPVYASSGTSTTNMAWDGADKIYHIRGNSTTEWGIYSISNNSWTLNSGAPLPNNASGSNNNHFVFVPQYISGLANNRLYHQSSTNMYYIDLDNDSGLRLGGTATFTSTGLVSDTLSGNSKTWINRHGRMFVHQGGTDQVISTTNTNSNVTTGRGLFVSDNLKQDPLQWKVADMFWSPEGFNETGNYGFYMDAYQSRVRTSISSTTNYHFIGDKDRIIVATLSDNIWSMCYAGAFNTENDNNTFAVLDGAVTRGHSRIIKLKNVIGNLEENHDYFILDVTGQNGYTSIHDIEGSVRRLVPGEKITVTSVIPIEDDVDGYYITASIRNDYPDGAKIGIDPQPVGVLMEEVLKFQTTSNLPGEYDDISGTDDRASQVYSMANSDEVVRQGFVSNRSNLHTVWPARFGTFEGEGFYEGKETRGKLKGVYVMANRVSGNTININGKGYLLVQTQDARTTWAIGPLED